ILHGIFAHLSTRDLKEVRKVSKFWENEANTILRNKTTYSFVRYYKSLLTGRSNPDYPPNIDLIRHISVVSYIASVPYYVDIRYPYFQQSFANFAAKYGDKFHSIYFSMSTDLYTIMFSLLSNIQFQNLKCLTTRVFKMNDDLFPQNEISELQTKFNMSNLRSFNIKNFELSETGSNFHAMASKIIKQAINLENLRINDETNFFPDLSSCKKLKYFKWKFHPFKSNTNFQQFSDNFTIQKILDMLNQVSETLQYFRAAVLRSCEDPPLLTFDPTLLVFPIMKKLTTLSLPTVNMFDLGFTKLTQNELPSLKRVELLMAENSYRGTRFLGKYITNGFSRILWTTVEELRFDGIDINCDTSEHIWSKIWQIFPNLKNFTVQIYGSMQSPNKMVESFRNLYQCPWNLTIMLFPKICTFSELMEAMRFGSVRGKDESALSHGSFKHISIVRCRTPSNTREWIDPGCTKYEEVFKIWQPNLSLHGFRFHPAALSRMVDFIQKNELKVSFEKRM
ncbi:hypothetical protein Fcan01_22972, partial [Folsomia candida]